MGILSVLLFLALSIWALVAVIRWFFFTRPERMTISLSKMSIIAILLLQFFFMAVTLYDPLHGPFDSGYRHGERLKAYLDWKQSQSPSSRAAYDAEMSLLYSHMATRNVAIFCALGLEAIGVYYLWNRNERDGLMKRADAA